VYTFSRRFFISNTTSGQILNFGEFNETRWNRTDITVTTWNGGLKLMEDLVVYRNITSSPQTSYIVDLMNPAYGISTSLAATRCLTAQRYDGLLNASYLTNYSYWPTLTTQSWTMGSLEYRGQNEYWVPQTYYYQLGGVFLEQNEGDTVKVPPAITLSMSGGIPVVKINEILLSGTGVIEGAGPVQVTSSVASISETPLVSGNNTRYVNITVRAQSVNASQMWLQSFNTTVAKAGFPSSIYKSGTSGLESYLNITSTDPRIYGVRLSVSKVIVNTAIQSAAPSIGG
jgi:hypothetical protein